MIQLGCIADDFTGATDLANNLARAGMRVVQVIGVPQAGPAGEADVVDDVDAVVVALKSRTTPAAEAVAQSLAACRALRSAGARQIYFKVCSTFDSTPRGNIGPVAEALAAELACDFALVTPAFPEAGRTVYQGHLFVGEQLLSDSPMRQHPLTPMSDANLVRVLQAQCASARVGLIGHAVVARGAAAVRERIDALRRQGVLFGIADVLADADLHTLAEATRDAVLVVAGSGLAVGIPAQRGFAPNPQSQRLPDAGGAAAVLSGSCSQASNAQVAHFIAGGGESFRIDPLRLAAGEDQAAAALAWAATRLKPQPLLVYATAEPAAVRAAQEQLGAERAGALVEAALARIATGLVAAGVRRLVVAGGETAGACVQALGVRRLRIGPQIDPGVPWCHSAQHGLHLALKSGNFGSVDFFTKAFGLLK